MDLELFFSPNRFPGSFVNLITQITRSGEAKTSERLLSSEERGKVIGLFSSKKAVLHCQNNKFSLA